MKTIFIVLSLVCCVCLSACKPEFEEISYGHDACAQCKMTILDKRYAVEVITKKGRAYKFDDLACMKKYIQEEHIDNNGLLVYVANYKNPNGKFIDARQAFFLHGEMFKTPMNGDYAAFSSKETAKEVEKNNEELLTWDSLK